MDFDVVIRRASDVIEDITEDVKETFIKEEPTYVAQDGLYIIEDDEDESIEYEGLSGTGMAFGADEEQEDVESPIIAQGPTVNETVPKTRMKFMTKVLIFSFLFVVVYTVWTQVAMVVWNVYPNDVVTEWVYKFFGIEIVLLFGKKLFDTWIANKNK